VLIAAAAAVSFAMMAPAQAHTGEHTVRSGDTLSKLAARHDTSWQTVYADNRDTIGADPNALRIGQVLTIGGSGSTPSSAAPTRSDKPTPNSSPYSMWDPHVRPVVQEVTERFDVSTVYTRADHHPTQGRAADFMVYTDQAKGDALTQYVIDNAARFRVRYVIWQQRIYTVSSGSWSAMEDRGSPTANHMDHVHVAFLPAT
jgi:LysM repeat protein